jgi:hypothetical protein
MPPGVAELVPPSEAPTCPFDEQPARAESAVAITAARRIALSLGLKLARISFS